MYNGSVGAVGSAKKDDPAAGADVREEVLEERVKFGHAAIIQEGRRVVIRNPSGAGLRIGCWDVWSGVLPAASQPSDECLRLTTIPPVFTHRSSFSQSPSGTVPCAFDRVGGADSTPWWQGHGPSIARTGTVPNDFSAYFEAAP